MKKIISKIRRGLGLLGLVALVATTLPAQAQSFQSRSFINCQALRLTNALPVTNLNSVLAIGGTNIYRLQFTNNQGTLITVTNGTGDKTKLLNTVDMFVDRNGAYQTTAATNANIFIRMGGGGANATNSLVFVFAAVPDGTNESTASADLFTVTTPPNTANPSTYRVGVPAGAFVGNKSLMLRSVSMTSAGTSFADSQIWLLECALNGFSP